ncbi:hypothetical protein FXO37_23648 [Capsicum annuum]|nr:hypothetical protein FXO37_23648 [Capsicum annuum]
MNGANNPYLRFNKEVARFGISPAGDQLRRGAMEKRKEGRRGWKCRLNISDQHRQREMIVKGGGDNGERMRQQVVAASIGLPIARRSSPPASLWQDKKEEEIDKEFSAWDGVFARLRRRQHGARQ